MDEERELKELMDAASRPKECEVCGGQLKFKGLGKYVCKSCQHEMMDDYGKVRAFLDLDSNAPIAVIEASTGVSKEFIKKMLDSGMVQVTGDSKVKLTCNRCGKEINFGRFCPQCAMDLANGIKDDYNNVRRNKKDGDDRRPNAGMHYIHRNK